MINKPTDHHATPTQPPIPIPDERISTEGFVLYEQLSVAKTVVLPSAQIPAVPPPATQKPAEPPQSNPQEK
jgi:hypothetical protein